MTYLATHKIRTAVFWAISLALVSGALLPTAVSAGVLSSLFAVFDENGGRGMGELTLHASDAGNVQTMPLPKAAMNLDPNPSKGGGDITIVDDSALLPEEGPSGTLADLEERPQSSQISVYVVREGDTLSHIANMFDVTTNTIRWANDLNTSDTIRPGQTLSILPITGIRYTIKNGGSLRDIIKKHGGDIDEAAQYNGLDPDQQLAAGTVVIVPDGELAIPKPAPQPRGRVVRGGGPSIDGYFIRPTSGVRTQGIHGYNAVDIGAPVGTPVVASASGDVIIVKSNGWNGGYGKYIVIRHNNGTQTLYAHNSSNIVGPGQRVVQGQVIGYVGSTGRSTGPHLHFEVRGAKNPF